jgi:hypothetical protein
MPVAVVVVDTSFVAVAVVVVDTSFVAVAVVVVDTSFSAVVVVVELNESLAPFLFYSTILFSQFI